MANPLRRLRRLRLSRVDMVPAGANPGAHITLFKDDSMRDREDRLRGEINQFAKGDQTTTSLHGWGEDWVVYELCGGGMDDALIRRAYTSTADGDITFGEPEEVVRQTSYVTKTDDIDPPGEKPPVEEPIVPDDQELELLRAKAAEQEAELEKARADLEAAQADVTKLAEVEAELAKVKEDDGDTAKAEAAAVRKELDETREALAKIETEQRTATFVAKARQFDGLGKPEEIAPLLMKADEHFTDEEKAKLEGLLKGATEQVAKGALFSQFSQPAKDGPDSWEERLNKAARERVEKGASPTVEQAKVAIMHEDAELRAEYNASARS